MDRRLNKELLNAYGAYLRKEERCEGTVKKYIRDLNCFLEWLGDGKVNKERAVGWKGHLIEMGYAPATVNSMLSSLNGCFQYLGWDACRVKFLRIQRTLFRDPKKELSREEYESLLRTARRQGKERLALLMEAICSTGIRVSEVKYITVEAARDGKARIALKGKIRTILLPGKLCRKLLKYARIQKRNTGEVFVTKGGKSLSRQQIWSELKKLCVDAGVDPGKVLPHNLRHLFARVFYNACRDIVKLADVLGHSSVETTRIYLVSTGEEHIRQLDRLRLVC